MRPLLLLLWLLLAALILYYSIETVPRSSPAIFTGTTCWDMQSAVFGDIVESVVFAIEIIPLTFISSRISSFSVYVSKLIAAIVFTTCCVSAIFD